MLPELILAQKLLMFSMAIPLVDLFVILKKKKKLASSKLGSYGDLGKLTGNDGLILSKKCQLSFKKTLEGVCVIAPTGEGKSTSITLPNLLSNDLPTCSIVIADPKGEQYKISAEYQRSIGRFPILFEPLGNNAKYNLLDNCEGFTEVRELASNLIINGGTGKIGNEWESMSIPLFASTLLNSSNISQALKFIINTPIDELNNILGNNKNEDIREQFKIFMASAGSPKTMSSIMTTLLTNLQLFTDHKIINNTSKSDFKPLDLRNRPIALYIKYDVAKSNYLAPFLSVFYTQLINKIMYGKGLPVLFILDEFQNIGKIKNFEEMVSVGRSENLAFLVCIQNISKLYDVYGKNDTTTILNNLKSKVILPSISDYDALNYISNLCGDTEIKTESSTGDKKTYSTATRKLFTADEIRRINNDKVLLICHNKLPYLDNQNIYYKQEKYIKNVI
ncbi:type IV secretory system conjugative DNA transfer family protein [Clostridium sp.]